MLVRLPLFGIAFSVLALSALVACSGGGASSPGPQPTSSSSPVTTQQIVGVAGTSMTLNGTPFLPRSVVIRGFTATTAYLQQNEPIAYTGQVNYGAAELASAHGYGADTLRFLISQPGLDPQSTLYDPGYLPQIEAAIALARSSGFIVEIAIQDESPSGDPIAHSLATDATVRDWDQLAPVYANDRGVLFELFNEPALPQSAANWQLWLNGGPVDTYTTVGMQAMIARIRSQNAQNVIVLDGLQAAHTLDGVPSVADPLNRLVYAVHPYPVGSADESQWDRQFGIPSQSLPVFADEWAAPAGLALGLGNLPSYQVAVDLVNYLRVHKIPLGGAGYDAPPFLVQTVPGWTPTNYDNYSPSATLDDAGLLIHNDFLANYGRVLTDADAVTH